MAQGAQSAQLFRLDLGRFGHALGEQREDLDPLDRVDPQVRLHVHVQVEHLRRVAGRLGDHGQEGRHEALGQGHGGSRHRRGGRRSGGRDRGGGHRCRGGDGGRPGDRSGGLGEHGLRHGRQRHDGHRDRRRVTAQRRLEQALLARDQRLQVRLRGLLAGEELLVDRGGLLLHRGQRLQRLVGGRQRLSQRGRVGRGGRRRARAGGSGGLAHRRLTGRGGGGQAGGRTDGRRRSGHIGAMVGAGQGDDHAGRAGRRARHVLPGGQVDRATGGGEAREHVREVAQATTPAGGVGGHREVRTVTEDAADEPRQGRPGANLDEDAHAGVVHRLDLLHEADRADQLVGEQRPALYGVVRVAGAGGVRVDRHAAAGRRPVGQGFGERGPRVGDEGAVERRADVEPSGAQSSGGARSFGRVDRRASARDDALLRAVAVREHDVQAALRDQRLDVGQRREHRQHGAAVRAVAGHEVPADRRQRPEGRAVHASGRVQRDQLAVAVTGGRVGAQAEAAEHRQQPRFDRAERRLGDLGGRQGGPVGVAAGRVERGHGVDPRGQVGLRLQRGEQLTEDHRRLGEHAGVLRPLSGEEEAEPAVGRADAVVHAVGQGPGGVRARRELTQGRGDHGVQPVGLDHEDQAMGRGRPERAARAGGRLDERAPQSLQRGAQAGGVVGRQRHDLHGVVPGGGAAAVLVLFEHDVVVAAAEAEGADPCSPHAVGEPRAGLRRQVDGRPLQGELGARGRDLEGRRDDLVVQRERRLDQACGAGRRLGVADLGLDGPQRGAARERAGLPEHGVERLELAQVAGGRAGAVSLDEADAGGAHARDLVGVAQRAGLAGRAGRVDRLRAAVAGGADAAHHRVDPVAVALSVRQPLQHDHADPLTEDRAVGVGRERPRVTRRRQGRRLAEAHVHEDVVERVDATGEHPVGSAGAQLHAGQVQRREGAGAGRVGDRVGAAEVEAVADPTGDDVAEQAGEAALLPRRVGLTDAFDDPAGRLVVHPGLPQGAEPVWMTEPRAERDDQLLRARDAQQDGGAGAVPAVVVGVAAGVDEGLTGDHQREQLRGVGRLKDVRRDAELGRVERVRVQERAALRVGAVGAARVLVEVVVRAPVAVRHVADLVRSGAHGAPEGGQVGRAGEEARHADDRDGVVVPGDPHVADQLGRRGGLERRFGVGRFPRLDELGHLVRGPWLPGLQPVQQLDVRRAQSRHPNAHRGAREHVVSDSDDRAGLRGLQRRAIDPGVERAHRRPCPHLVVQAAVGDPAVRPP